MPGAGARAMSGRGGRHSSSSKGGVSGGLLNTSEFQVSAEEDRLARANVKADVSAGTASAFAALARFGMKASSGAGAADAMGPSPGSHSEGLSLHAGSPGGDTSGGETDSPGASRDTSPVAARARWIRGASKVEVNLAARRMREAARLKALQRTPYPMVLARLKLLLERLTMLVEQENTRSNSRAVSASKNNTFRTASFNAARGSEAGGSLVSPPHISPGAKGADRHVAMLEPLDVMDSAPGGGPGDLQPLDKVREELAVTFAYVSEFLRKVPEDTRNAAINHARMENYKKDQTVYRMGEEPQKFYMILTGNVEVWSHPPHEVRKRTVLAQLKRGQSFGEKDILNDDVRTECVTPSSNCTFLVMDAAPFKAVFSEHFEQLLARAQDFFMHHVDMFSKVPEEHGHAIVRHMLLSTYSAGREWEPAIEPQIYFIKSGQATLESHDRRGQSVVITRAMLGLSEGGKAGEVDAPAVAETGILANVVLRDGRAVGTLGHEEEIRRLRRQLIPKKVIATLGVGSHFGGGTAAMGQGELQSSLRVLSATDVEAYHCHIEVFMKHASPELVSALRDDIAFKLTYCYGRVDMLGAEAVVGHPSSLLSTALAKTRERDDKFSGAHIVGHALGNGGGAQPATGGPIAPGPSAGKSGADKKRRKAVKHVHEPGQFNPEVEKALHYIKSLQMHSQAVQVGAMDTMARAKLVGAAAAEGVLPVPGYMEYLVNVGSTPAQRFWSVPALCASSARSTALVPMLKQVYPEGLAPLADKLDQLLERTAAAGHEPFQQRRGAGSPPGPGAGSHRPSTSMAAHADGRSAGEQLAARLDALDRASGGPSGLLGSSPSPRQLGPAAAGGYRPTTAPLPVRSTGALIAAGLQWERGQETSRTPALRQCLTYEEIARVRAEARK